MQTDWTSPILRAAAVEYIVQTIGPVPDRGGTHLSQWRQRAEACVKAFRLESLSELESWCRDASLQPKPDYASQYAPRPESAGVVDDAAIIEKAAAKIPEPNIPEGALPQRDILSDLLHDDRQDILSSDERSDLARALETGASLSRQQRTAIAVTLRGACTSSRADLVRAVIDFLLPPGQMERRIWECRSTSITVPSECTVSHADIDCVISGFPLLGRSILVVSRESKLERAIPYARLQSIRGSRSGRSIVAFRYLTPTVRFAKELIAKKLAYLADFVRSEGRDGTSWAALFNESKATVSAQRKSLLKRIRERTGARSEPRMASMRHK